MTLQPKNVFMYVDKTLHTTTPRKFVNVLLDMVFTKMPVLNALTPSLSKTTIVSPAQMMLPTIQLPRHVFATLGSLNQPQDFVPPDVPPTNSTISQLENATA